MKQKVHKLYIELADTPDKREKGLMFRRSLPQNNGMLFKFPSHQRLSFWMKNTYIPLDIAFISDSGKIVDIQHMSPLTTRPIYCNTPCRFALETNYGWFDRNNVEVGDNVNGLFFNNVRLAQNQMNQNQPNQDNQQPSEKVLLNFGLRDKIEYAEMRGLKLSIEYISNEHGHFIGPRLLSPDPKTGKFIVEHGPNGDLFKAFDESPTIQGNGWSCLGGQVKSFSFDGITKLDIVDANGQPLNRMKGLPMETSPNQQANQQPKKPSVFDKIINPIKNIFK